MRRIAIVLSLCAIAACAKRSTSSRADANAAIDSLNARTIAACRPHGPKLYATLWTDSARFEWPAFNTVRGPAALADMARSNWTSLRAMDLRLDVSSRRISNDNATEFGAFQQAYTD